MYMLKSSSCLLTDLFSKVSNRLSKGYLRTQSVMPHPIHGFVFGLLLSCVGAVRRTLADLEDHVQMAERKTSLTIIGFSGNNGLRSNGLLSAVAELNCGKFDSPDGTSTRIFGEGSKSREQDDEMLADMNDDFVNGVFTKGPPGREACMLPALWKQV